MNLKRYAQYFVIFLLSGTSIFVYNNCSPHSPTRINYASEANSISTFSCGDSTFSSDSFTAGSINGQNGWYVDPAANFDEQIVNLGGSACRGAGAWKINNSVVSGGFGNQPQSPTFTESAGESTVRTASGGDSMTVSFYFKTASNAADGSSFTVSLSPTTADRHNFLRFVNDFESNGGLRVYGLDGANLDQERVVAQNLARGIWHHVKILNLNIDGPDNDLVRVYLNGKAVNDHTTWETWRRSLPAPTLSVNRVLFRMSTTSTSIDPSFTAPQGFYIDDFEQKIFNYLTPTTVIESYSTGFEP